MSRNRKKSRKDDEDDDTASQYSSVSSLSTRSTNSTRADDNKRKNIKNPNILDELYPPHQQSKKKYSNKKRESVDHDDSSTVETINQLNTRLSLPSTLPFPIPQTAGIDSAGAESNIDFSTLIQFLNSNNIKNNDSILFIKLQELKKRLQIRFDLRLTQWLILYIDQIKHKSSNVEEFEKMLSQMIPGKEIKELTKNLDAFIPGFLHLLETRLYIELYFASNTFEGNYSNNNNLIIYPYYSRNQLTHIVETNCSFLSTKFELGLEYLDDIERASTELSVLLQPIENSIVENKKFSLSVHYRLVDEDKVADLKKIVKEVVQGEFDDLIPFPVPNESLLLERNMQIYTYQMQHYNELKHMFQHRESWLQMSKKIIKDRTDLIENEKIKKSKMDTLLLELTKYFNLQLTKNQQLVSQQKEQSELIQQQIVFMEQMDQHLIHTKELLTNLSNLTNSINNNVVPLVSQVKEQITDELKDQMHHIYKSIRNIGKMDKPEKVGKLEQTEKLDKPDMMSKNEDKVVYPNDYQNDEKPIISTFNKTSHMDTLETRHKSTHSNKLQTSQDEMKNKPAMNPTPILLNKNVIVSSNLTNSSKIKERSINDTRKESSFFTKKSNLTSSSTHGSTKWTPEMAKQYLEMLEK